MRIGLLFFSILLRYSSFIRAYACCQLVSDSCHSSLYARTAACGELTCNAHIPRTPA